MKPGGGTSFRVLHDTMHAICLPCTLNTTKAHHKGAERKSGVPYTLMLDARHRQTPFKKHDEKTRHVEHST